MLTRLLHATICLALTFLASTPARAHFLWLEAVGDSGPRQVQVYFSEDASPDDPALLARLQGVQLFEVVAGQEPRPLELKHANDTLSAAASNGKSGLFVATHDYGVISRGESTFRLKYYAKTGPESGATEWSGIDCTKLLPLDVLPSVDGGKIIAIVRFQGKPVAGSQVTASGPGIEPFEGTTDEQGRVEIATGGGGLYSIRARHIEAAGGEIDGKKYPETRHYSTVALKLPGASVASTESQTVSAKSHAVPSGIPPLETPVTSLGAAIANGDLYIYGGHSGAAHTYSEKDQGRTLFRTSVAGGKPWESLADGPARQGLVLVSHKGCIYRLGGFTALNAEGEKNDLRSQADVAKFDPKVGRWEEMPPLPEPRSSFDAAVLGDTIYVIGGWELRGQDDSKWHSTAWKLDLAASTPAWEPVPSPPFHRRALAVAAFDGKLFALGGMQEEGGPTARVDVFNPATGDWTEGPVLVGEKSLTGFGCSAFATGGRLYCSTINGDLERLNAKQDAWEVVQKLPTARFFHRMLAVDDTHLLNVGGASMETGKFDEVEIIEVR